MTALAAQSTTAPASALPLVGIVAVSLPVDGPALRSTWLDLHTLLVGYDPARITRDLTALIVTQQLGAYEDIDGGETA